MRAERLLNMALLLQARGRMTAAALAEELAVSVRTVYRDIDALSLAGIPVYTEAGPGGGCQLMEGYRNPLAELKTGEAAALLTLGLPSALDELGLAFPLRAAQQRARRGAGLPSSAPARVHLDMPRWFPEVEEVPHLPALARAARDDERVQIGYRAPGARSVSSATVSPFGLVNKAGIWYLVAAKASATARVYRAGRIVSVRRTGETFERPNDFQLDVFWDKWSAEFEESLPRLAVTIRASPSAIEVLPEFFGPRARAAITAAELPDRAGWRRLTLTFEHEGAAASRLAGLGGLVEVLSPVGVRRRIVALATATIALHAVEHLERPAIDSQGDSAHS